MKTQAVDNGGCSEKLPCVSALDMGSGKPNKYRVWTPWPQWINREGFKMHVSRGLFSTRESAQKALKRIVGAYNA